MQTENRYRLLIEFFNLCLDFSVKAKKLFAEIFVVKLSRRRDSDEIHKKTLETVASNSYLPAFMNFEIHRISDYISDSALPKTKSMGVNGSNKSSLKLTCAAR